MPKIVINRGRNGAERQLITERTTEINNNIKRTFGGDIIRINDIARFLNCSRQTVYRYIGEKPEHRLPAVRRSYGTKMFHSIDVARRLAELEVIQ